MSLSTGYLTTKQRMIWGLKTKGQQESSIAKELKVTRQTVGGTFIHNFTLTTGYKVFGYITDANGTPIQGAIAILDNHVSGWYSKADGYYFVTAPAGNYTLTVQPRTGANFTTYTLPNFAVNSDVTWNITVTS